MSYGSSELALGWPSIAIAVLAVTGIVLTLGWEAAPSPARSSDSRTLRGRRPHAARSHLSGYVRSVLVRDNQSVRAGDTIVQMVDDDLPRHGGGGRGRARSTRGTR
ncbi:MAG TPA: biotin/lipoyl-binding protein [Acetobacteraceae bacterium]|nr:biotin/lipoyl-binding protein [Acetobacteraceae bacterium]